MVDDQRAVYEALAQAHNSGIPVALVTIIATSGSIPRHTGSKMLIYPDGRIIGTVGGGAMEAQVIALAQTALADGKPRTETYYLNNPADGDPGICGGNATFFVEPILVAATLLVVGGGHVGKALAELGKWLGYRVVLSDDRPEYCNPDYAAGLDEYIVCHPGEISAKITINKHTYIAVVTRGLPVDEHLLPGLLRTEAAYIGLIGSKRRWMLTAQVLRERFGFTDTELQAVHAPIGLELEVEAPREIALSIMAEITMIRYGGTGKPMQWYGKLE